MSTTDDAHRAGTQAAHELITALAEAGMTADRIDTATEDVLGARHGHPTAVSEAFYTAFDHTAATYAAELRELEAG
jgi:hypothetical protein